MYAPLLDMFALALGYDRRAIDIDRAGTRGRPDLTIFAPGGMAGSRIPWIVVEAKDERDAVTTPARRAALFGEKAKYITADTAWFIMVDPTTLVARPVERGTDAGGDIEVPIAGLDLDMFAAALAALASGFAGVPSRLERFRAGDESLIGVDKLSGTGDALARRISRDTFFDGLRETTGLLQNAVIAALAATLAERRRIAADVGTFAAEFGVVTFTPYPIKIEGSPRGYEQTRAHGRAAHRLTRRLAAAPALSRLALDALPRFAARSGLDLGNGDDAARCDRFFAVETANLILARILLIRFLEDHGFFDEDTPDGTVRRRYLCNGGVEAFQGMRRYFGTHYTRLLEEAYQRGAAFVAVFDETEHDWVLALASPQLSSMVEWAMYRFARYDFTTIKGDVLTGVYDRFLDASQRKDKGEFYTPPSIARWMLDRLGLEAADSVFDPACGSGTFLIERYQQAVGEDADLGLASYADACAAVEAIAGNDLNPFSAVLTQIQLFWHLLAFGPAVRAQGLPLLSIAERANSLVPTILKDQSTTRFGDVDRDDYAAVVGNPPYVRPERARELDPAAKSHYEEPRIIDGQLHGGVSVNDNIYRLFVYRALDHWCANPPGARPGKVAFVLPLSFCSASEAADLRKLFAPGGRWTIREVVDMEMIWRSVFDADVLPMILIAEARPPMPSDTVTIHLADAACVEAPDIKGGRPSFDLDKAGTATIAYADLFAPDGRILTRLTPERSAIIAKLRANATLADAARRFWSRMRAGEQRILIAPPATETNKWQEQRLIRYGAALRGADVSTPDGLKLWKGENIRSGSLAGAPINASVDITAANSASIWAHPELLTGAMFALPLIEQIPCAAPFDPRLNAMLNTVILFGPRDDLADFPFDTLLGSRIYGYYSILSLRSSYMNKLRSHLYPPVIAALPWSETLVPHATALEAAGRVLNEACRRRFDAEQSLRDEAASLDLRPLKDVFKTHAPGSSLRMSEAMTDDEPFTVATASVATDDAIWQICPDAAAPTAWIEVPTEELARIVVAGLKLSAASELTRTSLLRLAVPADVAVSSALEVIIGRNTTDLLDAAIEEAVVAIDAVVGPALGLSSDDVAFIQTEMSDDPFLSRIRPRYPFFTPKQRGRRRTLESSARYSGSPSL